MAQQSNSQWVEVSTSTYQLHEGLDQRTVPTLWRYLQTWQPVTERVEIDLSHVLRVDSAGMAMLIHLIEHAKKKNCHIMLSFVPKQLHTLLQLSNIQSLMADHIQN